MNPSETDQTSASSAKPKFGAKFVKKEGPVDVQDEIDGEETDKPTFSMQKTSPSMHTHPTSPVSTEVPSKFTFEDDSSSRPKSPTSKEETSKIITITDSSSTATSRGQKSSVSETRRPVFVTISQHHTMSDITGTNDAGVVHDRALSPIHHKGSVFEPMAGNERSTISHTQQTSVLGPPVFYEQQPSSSPHKTTILEQAAAVAGGLIKQAAQGFNSIAFPKEEFDPSAIPKLPPPDTTSPLDKFIIQAGSSIADGLVSAGEIMMGAANAAFPRPRVPGPPKIKFQEVVTTTSPSHTDGGVYREFTLLPRAPGAHKKETERKIQKQEIKNIFPDEDPVQIYEPPEDLRRAAKPFATHVMLPLPPASGVDLTKYSEVSETLNETEERMQYLRGLSLARQSFFATHPTPVTFPQFPVEAQASSKGSNAEITSRYLEALEMTCKKANEQTAMLIDGNALQVISPVHATAHGVYKHKKCLGKQVCVMETIHSTNSSGSEDDEEPLSFRTREEVRLSSLGSSTDASYIDSRESKDILSGRTEHSILSTKTSNIKSSSRASTQQSQLSDYTTSKKRKPQRGMVVVCPFNSSSSSESVEKPSDYAIRSSNFRPVKLQTSDRREINENKQRLFNKSHLYGMETDETTASTIDEMRSAVSYKSKSGNSDAIVSPKRSRMSSDETTIPKRSVSPRLKTKLVGEIPTQTSYISPSTSQKTKHVGETKTQTSLTSSIALLKPIPVEEYTTQVSSLMSTRKQKYRPSGATSTETSFEDPRHSRQPIPPEKHQTSYLTKNSESKQKPKLIGQTGVQTSFLSATSDQEYFSSINTSMSGRQIPHREASEVPNVVNESIHSNSNWSHKKTHVHRQSHKDVDISKMSTISDIHYLPSLTMPHSETRTIKESTSTVQPSQTKRIEKQFTRELVIPQSEMETRTSPKVCQIVRIPPLSGKTSPQNLHVDVDVRVARMSNAVLPDHSTQSRRQNTQGTCTDPVANNIQGTRIDPVANNIQGIRIDPVANNIQRTRIDPVVNNNQGTSINPSLNNTQGTSVDPMANNNQGTRMDREANNSQGTNIGQVAISKEIEANLQINGPVDRNRTVGASDQLKHVGKMKGGSLASGMDKATLISTTRTSRNKDFGNFSSMKSAKRNDFESGKATSPPLLSNNRFSPKHDFGHQKRSTKKQRPIISYDSSLNTENLLLAENMPSLAANQSIFETREADDAEKKINMNWMLASLLKTLAQKKISTSDKKVSVYERTQQSKFTERENLKEGKLKRNKPFPINSRSGNTKAFHSRHSAKFPPPLSTKPATPYVAEFSNKRSAKQSSKFQKNRMQEETVLKSKSLWRSSVMGCSPSKQRSPGQSHGYGTSMANTHYRGGTGHSEKASTSRSRRRPEDTESCQYSPKICRRLGITLYLAPPLESTSMKRQSPLSSEEKTTVLKFYLGNSQNKTAEQFDFLNNKVRERPTAASTSTSSPAPPASHQSPRRIVFEVDSKKTTDKLTIIMQSESSKAPFPPEIRAELIEDGKRKKLEEFLEEPLATFHDINVPNSALQNIIQAVNIEEHPASAFNEKFSMAPTVTDLNEIPTAYNPTYPPSQAEVKSLKVMQLGDTREAHARNEPTTGQVNLGLEMPNVPVDELLLMMGKQPSEAHIEKPLLWQKATSSPLQKGKCSILKSVTSEQPPNLDAYFNPPNLSTSPAAFAQKQKADRPSTNVQSPFTIDRQGFLTSETSSRSPQTVETATVSSLHEKMGNSTVAAKREVAQEAVSSIHDAHIINSVKGNTKVDTSLSKNTLNDTERVLIGSSSILSDSSNIDETFKTFLQQRYAEIFATDVNNSNPSTAANYPQQSVSLQLSANPQQSANSNQSVNPQHSINSQQSANPQQFLSSYSPLLEEMSNEDSNQSILARIPQLVFSKASTLFQAESFYKQNSGLVLNVPGEVTENTMGGNEYYVAGNVVNGVNEIINNSRNLSGMLSRIDECKPGPSDLVGDNAHLVLSIPSIITAANSETPTPIEQQPISFCSNQKCSSTSNTSTVNESYDRCCELVVSDNAKSDNQVFCSQTDGLNDSSYSNFEGDIETSNATLKSDYSAYTSSNLNQKLSYPCEITESNSVSSFSTLMLNPNEHQDTSLVLGTKSETPNSVSSEPKYMLQSQTYTNQRLKAAILNLTNDSNETSPISSTQADSFEINMQCSVSGAKLMPEENSSRQTMAALNEYPLGERRIGALSSVVPYTQTERTKSSPLHRQSVIGAEDYRALVASLPRLTRPYKKNLNKLLQRERNVEKSPVNDENIVSSILRHPATQLASISEVRDSEHDGLDEERSGRITFMPLLPPEVLLQQLSSDSQAQSRISTQLSKSNAKNVICLTSTTSREPMLVPMNLGAVTDSLDSRLPASEDEERNAKDNREKLTSSPPSVSHSAFHPSESSQTVRRQLEHQTAALLQLFTPSHKILPQSKEQQ